VQVFTAVIIRAVIGAAETASFDTVGETIRTNHYQADRGWYFTLSQSDEYCSHNLLRESMLVISWRDNTRRYPLHTRSFHSLLEEGDLFL
jgi:hypothetical protein